MPVLADPKTIAGPLRAADLAEARAFSTGNVYRLPMQCPPCHGQCNQGRLCNALESCAAEGGAHAEPVDSAKPDRGPLLGVILILTGWPLLAAAVSLLVFFADQLRAAWLLLGF